MKSRRPPLLGDLETAVMEVLWSRGSADVKAVHARIGGTRGIALNTVQSTMERLYRKGFLGREKVSHAYVYTARLSRQETRAEILEEVIHQVVGDGMEPMLSAFVDLAERAGEDTLDRLERMIAQRRVRHGQSIE